MTSPYAPPTHDEPPKGAGRPSPGWAALMSLLVPGVGQFYAGETLRGVLFCAGQSLVLFAMMGLALHSAWLVLAAPLLAWVVFGIVAAIDARAVARRSTFARGPWVVILTGFLFVIGGRVVAAAMQARVVEVAVVPSGGMRPTLLRGDNVLVDKNARSPERGDIALFQYPENRSQHFLQRVVGMPGDTIRMNGRDLFINDTLVPKCEVGSWQGATIFVEWLEGRAHLIAHSEAPATGSRTWAVSRDGFFMLGDNRDASHDSRHWFAGKGRHVPDDHLLGRLTGIWFSAAGRHNFERIGIEVDGAALPPDAQDLQPALDHCLASGGMPP